VAWFKPYKRQIERIEKMFKKIIVGTLILGLVGILVIGALNRTNSNTGSTEGRGQGRGRSNEATTYTTSGGRGQGGYPQDTLKGRGQGRGNADQLGAGQAQVVEGLTLQGAVVSVDNTTLLVQTSSGEQVTVENRPWQYALGANFSAQVGDQVTLTGYYQSGVFEVSQINNLTNGKSVVLRDATGRPGWSGRGQRNSG
jgi:hypothetical protein